METRSWSDVYRVQSEAIDRHLARIAALEAAARAVTARGRVCGCLVYDGHAPECPVRALAALLTEATPTQGGAGEGA